MLPALHLLRPAASDGDARLAAVSLEPASAPGTWLLRVARGKKAGQLGGTVYGPYPTSVVRERYEEAIAALEAEGFIRAGRGELIGELSSSSPAIRGRAAKRLGWSRDEGAVAALLAGLPTAKRATPSFLDALGRIGDPRAVEAIRPYAARKLLSRRRSAVEALRSLGDAEGLAQARQRGLERLPPNVVEVLATLDEHDLRKANLAALLEVLGEVDVQRRGLVADVLYEADTPATVAATRRLLRSVAFEQPHLWRYTKSIFKRSMLRDDARTFGWLAHAIEERARISKGTTATLKSGLDGKPRSTTVFSKKTQAYVRRRGWRYLRQLARWRPDRYAEAAAEVLVHYGPEDLRPPKGRLGRFAECYLLARILFSGANRFVFDTRAMRVRFRSATAATPPPPIIREEAFPELWDARPEAYLRVAAAGKLPEVLEFGAQGLARHPRVVKDARTKVLLGLLVSGHTALAEIGIAELERRFDASSPNLAIIRRLLRQDAAGARELGVSFAERSASAWATNPAAVVELLLTATGAAGARIALAAAGALERVDVEQRHAVADAILKALAEDEPTEGAHAPLAELAQRALLSELEAALSTGALLSMLDSGSSAARALAGALLGRRPEAFAILGVDRIRTLAESELIAVRRGAHALLESAPDALRDDPSALFILAESRWADTRALAQGLIRDVVGFENLGLEGLIGLCDSSHAEVRALGRELLTEHFEELDPAEVLFRLVEHPARDMRSFALTLVEAHLAPGFVPLSRIESFCRAALMDLSPDRDVKRRLLEFLVARGEADERQAEVVVSLLSRVVRTHTLSDFESILMALTRVQLAHPDVSSPVKVAS